MVAVRVASFASGIALLEVVTTARHANGDASFGAVTTYGSSHARWTLASLEVVTTALAVTCITSLRS